MILGISVMVCITLIDGSYINVTIDMVILTFGVFTTADC